MTTNFKVTTPYLLSRSRRIEVYSELNASERSAFASLNSSIGCIGTIVSPFGFATANRVQQHLTDVAIACVIKRVTALKK